MKNFSISIFTLFASAFLFGSSVLAQELPGKVAATTLTKGKFQYPRVDENKVVYFELNAPAAKSVQVDILGKKYEMQKNEKGIWTGKTDPLFSGIHYYSMIVDGLSIPDPGSQSFYGCSKMMSCVEVPYPVVPEAPYILSCNDVEVKDVPHGVVSKVDYFSPVADSWRSMYVYTPAGYDKELTTRFPVLYIMHGGGEDCNGWVQQGRGGTILDNLAAAGKAEKMILVSFDGNMGAGLSSPIEKEIVDVIVPFIDKNYRTLATADKRALAGLSMGGIVTLQVGIPNYNVFNYLGVFSSGFFTTDTRFMKAEENPAERTYKILSDNKDKFNAAIKEFWIGIGGKEDIAFDNCLNLRKRLDSMGVKYEFYDHNFGGHTWPVWREDLFLFAQKIFK